MLARDRAARHCGGLVEDLVECQGTWITALIILPAHRAFDQRKIAVVNLSRGSGVVTRRVVLGHGSSSVLPEQLAATEVGSHPGRAG